jgi:hypothetical protein
MPWQESKTHTRKKSLGMHCLKGYQHNNLTTHGAKLSITGST